MLVKVISGGQSGADQAGLRAAKAAGLPTGGYAPRGWLVETGPAPWLADEFGLAECPEPEGEPSASRREWEAACYRARTRRNAVEATSTIWFGETGSPGFLATRKAAHVLLAIVRVPQHPPPADIVKLFRRPWWAEHPWVLNVAGSRESKAPGIGAWVERYLGEVFRLLAPSSEPA